MTVLEERLARINAEWERVRYHRDRYFCGPTAVALAANVSLEQAESVCAGTLGRRTLEHLQNYIVKTGGGARMKTAPRVCGMMETELQEALARLNVSFTHAGRWSLCVPEETPFRETLESLKDRVGPSELYRLNKRIDFRRVTVGLLRHVVPAGIYVVSTPGHFISVEVTAGNKRIVVADSFGVGVPARRPSGVGYKVCCVWRINP